LIDGHVHNESSMVTLQTGRKSCCSNGTTSVSRTRMRLRMLRRHPLYDRCQR
jgi:hypothetical protein